MNRKHWADLFPIILPHQVIKNTSECLIFVRKQSGSNASFGCLPRVYSFYAQKYGKHYMSEKIGLTHWFSGNFCMFLLHYKSFATFGFKICCFLNAAISWNQLCWKWFLKEVIKLSSNFWICTFEHFMQESNVLYLKCLVYLRAFFSAGIFYTFSNVIPGFETIFSRYQLFRLF